MNDPVGEPSPPVRIGTAERNAALQALDAHLEAGRLDAMEYGERSATVAEARTADQIRPLFADLPAPHPELPGASGAGVGVVSAGSAGSMPSGPPATGPSGAVEAWGPRIASVMPFVALALFLIVPGHIWLFFLLVPAAGMLFAGSRGGHGGHDERHDDRDERRARREHRRDERDERGR